MREAFSIIYLSAISANLVLTIAGIFLGYKFAHYMRNEHPVTWTAMSPHEGIPLRTLLLGRYKLLNDPNVRLLGDRARLSLSVAIVGWFLLIAIPLLIK